MAEDKESFQVVHGTTTTISPEMDPRGDPEQAAFDFEILPPDAESEQDGEPQKE